VHCPRCKTELRVEITEVIRDLEGWLVELYELQRQIGITDEATSPLPDPLEAGLQQNLSKMRPAALRGG
jgi:hypothetical protein